jgi:signal transduction histidine kinase
MRSIRRSLIVYFSLLVLSALGAVALVVHELAASAQADRAASATARIEEQSATNRAEAERKFKEDLERQAIDVGRDLRGKVGILGWRDREREAEEHARYQVALFLSHAGAAAATPWSVTVTQPVRHLQLFPSWGRFGWGFRGYQWHLNLDAIQRSFIEGSEHAALFQIQFPRSRRVFTGPQPSAALPPLTADELNQMTTVTPPKFSTVTLGDVGYLRVVLAAPAPPPFGGPFRGWNEPGRAVMATLGGVVSGIPPTYWVERGADFLPLSVVQCAMPRAPLDKELASLQAQREADLAAVAESSNRAMTELRSRLAMIAVITFCALALGGWFLVGRGLAPLQNLTVAVSRVSEKDFNLPIEQDELSTELVPIHDRLTHTLDALRRAFDREKQAVADISHELRTPLAALLSTIDVSLRKPREAVQYKTTLEECRDISKQLSRLVERIMTLAYLDAGNDRTRSEPVDVGDLAAECAAVIRPLAEAHGLSFRATIDHTVQLDTDPDKLREVLLNLLHNAVEYNSTGGKIELKVARGRGAVAFEVRDTGIGMPPDVRAKIFERFYRADPSRHATGVHAGLGLSIVKEYVERLGGTIAVESAVGQGSTFRVSLPATDIPEAAEEREPAGLASSTPRR